MSGFPPVMARKPRATSSVDRASHTSLYDCSSAATAFRMSVWRGSCRGPTCLEAQEVEKTHYVTNDVFTNLLHFGIEVPQDDLVIALIPVN